ncbi:MAG: peptidylprolyl isomerase [Microbacteriaceae bacterium]
MAVNKLKQNKEVQGRVRDFQARNEANRRRLFVIKRDNIIAIVISIVAIIAVVSVQFFISQNASPENPDTSKVAPSPDLAENRIWTGEMKIDQAALEFELFGDLAPQAVSSFVNLANKDFFEKVSCHRLTNYGAMSVLQCGDPLGNGLGGPGYTFGPIENAPADQLYPAGYLAMARPGENPNGMGSQFFIILSDAKIPNDNVGGYTVFGKITSGLDDLIKDVTSLGVVGGAEDGKPVAPAVLSSISVE